MAAGMMGFSAALFMVATVWMTSTSSGTLAKRIQELLKAFWEFQEQGGTPEDEPQLEEDIQRALSVRWRERLPVVAAGAAIALHAIATILMAMAATASSTNAP